MERRSCLSDEHVSQVFDRFSRYDFDGSGHRFFSNWSAILDGLKILGEPLSFTSGTLCAVDVVKCPAQLDWGAFVHKSGRASSGVKYSKMIWRNCGWAKGRNRYLIRQVALHQPSILFFAGTGGLVPAELKGRRNDRLLHEARRAKGLVTSVRTWRSPRRLCIEFGSARGVRDLASGGIRDVRGALQAILHCWETDVIGEGEG